MLEELALTHEMPRLVLEWRALHKLKSTYVDALPALVEPATGRIHTTFNQTVAATGRLSSTDPNLQNIPVRTEIGNLVRRAFVRWPLLLLVGWALLLSSSRTALVGAGAMLAVVVLSRLLPRAGFVVVSVVGALPHVKAGRLTAIAVTSASRFRLLPELPTVAEAGIPGFAAANWFGILAPAGTPREVVLRVNRDINDALASAEVRAILTKAQIRPRGGTPEQFGELMRSESQKWGPVIRYTGASLD